MATEQKNRFITLITEAIGHPEVAGITQVEVLEVLLGGLCATAYLRGVSVGLLHYHIDEKYKEYDRNGGPQNVAVGVAAKQGKA